MSDLLRSTCQHCKSKDTDPKFTQLIHVSQRRAFGRRDALAFTAAHHDCAVRYAGSTPASVIVNATRGVTGRELRARLTDLDHPVHALMRAHTLRSAATIAVENYRVEAAKATLQGRPLPLLTVDTLLDFFADVAPMPEPNFVDHCVNLVGLHMVTALTQTQANMILNTLLGSGSWTARTGAIVLQLNTAVGSQSAAGTIVSGGSYANQTCAFGSASSQTGTYASQIANSGTPTFTNMPAVTVTSVDLFDSAGTPVRQAWGSLTASKTTNSGDTVSVAVGAITVSI